MKAVAECSVRIQKKGRKRKTKTEEERKREKNKLRTQHKKYYATE